MSGQMIALTVLLAFGPSPQSPAPSADGLGPQLQQALADHHQFRVSSVCDQLLLVLASGTYTVPSEQRMPMAMVCVQSRKTDFDWASAQRLLERAGIPKAVASPGGVRAPSVTSQPPR